MKTKSITIGKKILIKDIKVLNEVIKKYIIEPHYTLNIHEYYIETNIPQYEDFSFSILINGMSGAAINSNDEDAIPMILNKPMKFLLSADKNHIVKIVLNQKKIIDINSDALLTTVTLPANTTVTDLYIKIFLFGELNYVEPRI